MRILAYKDEVVIDGMRYYADEQATSRSCFMHAKPHHTGDPLDRALSGSGLGRHGAAKLYYGYNQGVHGTWPEAKNLRSLSIFVAYVQSLETLKALYAKATKTPRYISRALSYSDLETTPSEPAF